MCMILIGDKVAKDLSQCLLLHTTRRALLNETGSE
jgi:hypothetical protein